LPLPVPVPAVSGTEAQFMARQGQSQGQGPGPQLTGDIAQNYWPFQPPQGSPKKQQHQQHQPSFAGPAATGAGPEATLHVGGLNYDSSTLIDTVGEAMRDRILSLEKQVPEPY